MAEFLKKNLQMIQMISGVVVVASFLLYMYVITRRMSQLDQRVLFFQDLVLKHEEMLNTLFNTDKNTLFNTDKQQQQQQQQPIVQQYVHRRQPIVQQKVYEKQTFQQSEPCHQEEEILETPGAEDSRMDDEINEELEGLGLLSKDDE